VAGLKETIYPIALASVLLLAIIYGCISATKPSEKYLGIKKSWFIA
jgi:hypothetical protein